MIAPVGTHSLKGTAFVLLLGLGGALYAERQWQAIRMHNPVVQCTGPRCLVNRVRLQNLLGHRGALGSSVRILPVGCNGQGSGVRLYAVRPDSLLAKLGIRSGDIVRSVNGIVLSSPDKAIGLYHTLRTAHHVAVALDRDGRSIVMHYKIM